MRADTRGPRFGLTPLLPCLVLAGCTTLPARDEFTQTTAVYPDGVLTQAEDGRARFREIFCGLPSPDSTSVAGQCDRLLWRLADETSAGDAAGAVPRMAAGLRVFVVSGAFGDCRKLDTIPFGDEIAHLSAQGVKIQAVMVNGRSSPEHNARQLAAAVEEAGVTPDERIVLIGYSKGAVDILQFLVDHPDRARQVAAVVSVAGPIYGSPLASDADWWYRTFFAGAFAGMCDPGDGGVISSLRPEVRRQWLEQHPLPSHVEYFSMAAFTTARHLARGLTMSWRMLAGDDPRNDGQVLIEDAVIPHSTLLGYANADHWDVAIAIERQMPYLSHRDSPRTFPRARLLEALLLYVSDVLDQKGSARGRPRGPG